MSSLLSVTNRISGMHNSFKMFQRQIVLIFLQIPSDVGIL
jgi:hypothetical protein